MSNDHNTVFENTDISVNYFYYLLQNKNKCADKGSVAVNSNSSSVGSDGMTISSSKRNNSDSFTFHTGSHTCTADTVATDPAKKLRNLRKKLRDIEALEKKLNEGIISKPEPEQLEKVARKIHVESEIDELERQLGS